MKKKKIVLFIIFILIILFVMGIFIILNIRRNQFEHTYDIIKDKLKQQESFLIYITNDDPYQCSRCSQIDQNINFYQDVYQLKFIYYYVNKNSAEDLEKLNKEFEFPDNYLTNPAVIIIKDGIVQAVANDMISEEILKQYLIDYQFIDKKFTNIETDLSSDELFDSVYNREQNSLIVVSNYSIDLKKQLYQLALENNFEYYVIYAGVLNYYNSYNALSKEIGNLLDAPSFVIVKGRKVIDYSTNTDIEKIKNFLRKNSII